MPHTIRLAGPWQIEPLHELVFRKGIDEPRKKRRVKLPCSWQELFGDQAGTARFFRSFNAPTGIEKARVFLTLDHPRAEGETRINQQVLISFSEEEEEPTVEIGAVLKPANKLELKLHCHPQDEVPAGLHAPVRIVIEETT